MRPEETEDILFRKVGFHGGSCGGLRSNWGRITSQIGCFRKISRCPLGNLNTNFLSLFIFFPDFYFGDNWVPRGFFKSARKERGVS